MSRSLASSGGARRIVLHDALAGPRGHLGGLKAQVRCLGGNLGGFRGPSWGHFGTLGGYLGDLRGYVGRSWYGKPKNMQFVSIYARWSAGLGCHCEGLRTTDSVLGDLLGAREGHLEAILEVLGVILVDSLGVIEVSVCRDRWYHWEVQFVSYSQI